MRLAVVLTLLAFPSAAHAADVLVSYRPTPDGRQAATLVALRGGPGRTPPSIVPTVRAHLENLDERRVGSLRYLRVPYRAAVRATFYAELRLTVQGFSHPISRSARAVHRAGLPVVVARAHVHVTPCHTARVVLRIPPSLRRRILKRFTGNDDGLSLVTHVANRHGVVVGRSTPTFDGNGTLFYGIDG